MDKLQKILNGIWHYKERIVLVVLLGFLAYRVYELFNPTELDIVIAEERGEAAPPEIPPNPPAPDAPGEYRTLERRSPFSYYSDAKLDGDGGISPEELGLALLDIKEVGNRWRARLRTPGADRKWYWEGDSFEEFVLEEVNPEEGTAVIYVERLARSLTLRLR